MTFPGLSAAPLLMKGVIAGGPSTWNPLDKSATIVLSNGDLTAEATNISAPRGVRSTFSKSSGKLYFEVVLVTNGGTGRDEHIGFKPGGEPFTDFTGTSADSMRYTAGGTVVSNSAALVSGAPYNAGTTVSVAIDLNTRSVYFARNGVWINSANPSTGAGALSLGGSGPSFVTFGAYEGTPKMTANFGASSFTYAIPSGYVSWDDGA